MTTKDAFEIHLTGFSTISRLADYSILKFSIASEGTSKAKVSEVVTVVSKDLQDLFDRLNTKDPDTGSPAPSAAVTSWTMAGLSTQTWVPSHWDNDKKEQIQEERKHGANNSFSVKFKDFAVLSDIATELASREFVTVNSVTWGITDETRNELAGENRKKAMQDAMTKARDYATTALGNHAVARAVHLEEVNDGRVQQQMARAKSALRTSAPESQMQPMPQTQPMPQVHFNGMNQFSSLHMKPQDVDLSAFVKVKFVVE